MLELKTAAFISASRSIIGAVEYRQSSSVIVNHSFHHVEGKVSRPPQLSSHQSMTVPRSIAVLLEHASFAVRSTDGW